MKDLTPNEALRPEASIQDLTPNGPETKKPAHGAGFFATRSTYFFFAAFLVDFLAAFFVDFLAFFFIGIVGSPELEVKHPVRSPGGSAGDNRAHARARLILHGLDRGA
ncbi:MAG TPA: hypothetical protein VFG84_09545 [Gemmatimonadaceae bacterium]|nr:hypothetical protein [Gemmatimonadaceae bacterium]